MLKFDYVLSLEIHMANRVKKDRSAIRKARKANRSYINQTFRSKVEINEENIGYLNEMSIKVDVKKVAEQAVISDLQQETKQEKINLKTLLELKIKKIQELKKVTEEDRKVAIELAKAKQLYGNEDRILDENGDIIEEREVQEKAVVSKLSNVTPIRDEDEELAI
jgi:hypothetical protein